VLADLKTELPACRRGGGSASILQKPTPEAISACSLAGGMPKYNYFKPDSNALVKILVQVYCFESG